MQAERAADQTVASSPSVRRRASSRQYSSPMVTPEARRKVRREIRGGTRNFTHHTAVSPRRHEDHTEQHKVENKFKCILCASLCALCLCGKTLHTTGRLNARGCIMLGVNLFTAVCIIAQHSTHRCRKQAGERERPRSWRGGDSRRRRPALQKPSIPRRAWCSFHPAPTASETHHRRSRQGRLRNPRRHGRAILMASEGPAFQFIGTHAGTACRVP